MLRCLKSVNTPVVFDGKELSLVGLNLQAIINLKDLPVEIVTQLSANTNQFDHFSQLILIGHGGRLMWEKLNESVIESEHPVDDFSKFHVQGFFAKRLAIDDFELVFPTPNENNIPIGLQALGEMAGWHHPSPFGVGINQQWGSWFAYRVVVLVKSDYQTSVIFKGAISKADVSQTVAPEAFDPKTAISEAQSPCQSCETKPCIQNCPASALEDKKLNLKRCVSYRMQARSKCKDRCLARMSCPVAAPHQYELEQIQYHYGRSLETIRRTSR